MKTIFPFRIQVIFRLLLIIGFGVGSIYIAFNTDFWLMSIWTSLLAIVLGIDLIRLVEKNHRELHHFLEAIAQNDFSNTFFSTSTLKPDLKSNYDKILSVFRDLRSEKASQYQYVQTIVEHVGQALLCFNEKEEVLLINQAARQLFKRPYLQKLAKLELLDPDLLELIRSISVGDQQLYKFNQDGRLIYLSIEATTFKLIDVSHKLVSFRDITKEMEGQELASWQKLIRVLTHEITNSVIPISTLSELSHQMLEDGKGNPVPVQELSEEDVEDLRGNLKTISGRSKGLAGFVQNYRSLTQLSSASLQISRFPVHQLIDRVLTLLGPKFKTAGIELVYTQSDKEYLLQADFDRIEQILINLLINAADASKGRPQPEVLLSVKEVEHDIQISVVDNGEGIPAALLDQIFIPFFTTKKEGSGIGLSLARQIMRMHNGNISVQSEEGVGSKFMLQF